MNTFNDMDKPTIPRVIYNEFSIEPREKLGEPFSYPEEVAPVAGFDEFYMIIRTYGPGEDNLEVMFGDINDRDTVFNFRIIELTQQWTQGGAWSAYSGNLLRYTLKGNFGVLRGTSLTGATGDLITKVLVRVNELVKGYELNQVKWEFPNGRPARATR